MRRFISGPIAPAGDALITWATGSEPPVPAAFAWEGRTLNVARVVRSRRSTKDDRGDNYLKRHWFELETAEGPRIEVYFDREARRGTPQWWLYTIDE